MVKTKEGNIGFLAAFSGILNGSNQHSYFVPPIYDLLHPDGYFKTEENEITAINRRIKELSASDEYNALLQQLTDLNHQFQLDRIHAKEELKRRNKNVTDFEKKVLVNKMRLR